MTTDKFIDTIKEICINLKNQKINRIPLEQLQKLIIRLIYINSKSLPSLKENSTISKCVPYLNHLRKKDIIIPLSEIEDYYWSDFFVNQDKINKILK